jgi:lipid-binding SYLF domain-containing protein
MMRWCFAVAVAAGTVGCAPHPPSMAQAESLDSSADATLADMQRRDPGLTAVLDQSAGYAVFPDIGAAGVFIAGGAAGKGVLYEHGHPTGYVELRQGSVGPQLGGQTYSELVVLRDPFDVDKLKANTFDLGAEASAVALTTGAASSAQFENGAAVFVVPRGGLMAGVSISGQQITFLPAG